MSLKHAILGLLLDRPMHGYELKRGLSPALSRDGLVNDGVLYPLLSKLEKEGFVEKRVEPGAGRPDRHVLHPTKKGERWFYEWLENNSDEEDEVTYDFFLGHPFLTKCMFFDRLDADEITAKLEAQKRSAAAKLDAFLLIKSGMMERGVDPYRVAILDLGVAQQREKIRWLDRLMDTRPRARARRRSRKEKR
jgi:DNA-binding PadR family transcriptional regulator